MTFKRDVESKTLVEHFAKIRRGRINQFSPGVRVTPGTLPTRTHFTTLFHTNRNKNEWRHQGGTSRGSVPWMHRAVLCEGK